MVYYCDPWRVASVRGVCIFAIVLFSHVLVMTPKAVATESQAEEEAKETARNPTETNVAPLNNATPDPPAQVLTSAATTVDVTIKTTKKVNFHSFESGGYAAIATAQGPLLITRGGDCSGTPSGAGEATFHGVFQEMAGGSPTGTPAAIGQPIASLRSAKFIQIEFAGMKENPVVLRGQVVFTLNNSRQLRFEIPPQTGVGKKIYVRDLSSGMNALGLVSKP